MISTCKIFILISLFNLNSLIDIKANVESKIPKIVFGEIEKTNHLFNEENLESLKLSCIIPKKIFTKSIELFYKDLGKYEKEKKIIISEIQEKGEVLSLKTSIIRKNKETLIYISDGESLSRETTINNLLISIQKILKRKFLNDYIIEIENDIKRIDKKQNKIIRKNPTKLEMNNIFFYKVYQKKESKKVGLIAALEKLYEELDDVKKIYNTIR